MGRHSKDITDGKVRHPGVVLIVPEGALPTTTVKKRRSATASRPAKKGPGTYPGRPTLPPAA